MMGMGDLDDVNLDDAFKPHTNDRTLNTRSPPPLAVSPLPSQTKPSMWSVGSVNVGGFHVAKKAGGGGSGGKRRNRVGSARRLQFSPGPAMMSVVDENVTDSEATPLRTTGRPGSRQWMDDKKHGIGGIHSYMERGGLDGLSPRRIVSPVPENMAKGADGAVPPVAN